MSEGIDQIVKVLSKIRAGWIENPRQLIEVLRIAAVNDVAHGRVTRGTVRSAYIRGLMPDVGSTGEFNKLVDDWLNRGSPRLEQILLDHTLDSSDERIIRELFHPDRGPNLHDNMRELTEQEESSTVEPSDFQPTTLEDERRKVAGTIVVRRGQPAFRADLLLLYDGKCAITGTSVQEVLEACHIMPYIGDKTDHLSNGLLLRADIHLLHDQGLIAVDEESYQVRISSLLKDTEYAVLADKRLRLPADSTCRPDKAALRQHREAAQL